jgi:hypothetical protein
MMRNKNFNKIKNTILIRITNCYNKIIYIVIKRHNFYKRVSIKNKLREIKTHLNLPAIIKFKMNINFYLKIIVIPVS